MSGALSQNVILPSYGQRVKTDVPPPALSYNLVWRSASNYAVQQSHLVFFDATKRAGALGTYILNLGDIIRMDSRTPFAQSMYVDNRKNGVDVHITISGTNVGFTAPAFSCGMYPLIADSSPTLTFQVHDVCDGPTLVDIFAEMLPPFCFVDCGRGQARNLNKALYTMPINIPGANPGIYTSVSRAITYGVAPNSSGIYPIGNNPTTTGRLVVKRLQYDIIFQEIGAQNDQLYLALCEAMQDVNGVWYVNPIIQRFIIVPGGTINTFTSPLSFNVVLDPPFMGSFQANPTTPIVDPSGNPLNNGPQLVWAVASSNIAANLIINTAMTVDTVLPSPHLGTPQSIYGY